MPQEHAGNTKNMDFTVVGFKTGFYLSYFIKSHFGFLL